jgi:hypothetical protein
LVEGAKNLNADPAETGTISLTLHIPQQRLWLALSSQHLPIINILVFCKKWVIRRIRKAIV